MARVNMRTVVNKAGVTYTASDTDRIFAEDILAVKEAIDDATTGINTLALEIQGTTVINSSGAIQNGTGVKVYKDKKRGSNCSGSDGAKNRVLTLTNTKTTTAVLVVVDGVVAIEDADYTASHLAASSTVTFLNNLANTSYIEAVFWS